VTAPTWVLRFPAPADWLSANKRYKRRPDEQVRAWRHATAVHAAAQHLPRGLPQVSIYATLHFTDRRRRDAHNFMLTVKSCIDGLVDYGLIADDRREHLLWTAVTEGDPVPKPRYGPPGEITLTILQVDAQGSDATGPGTGLIQPLRAKQAPDEGLGVNGPEAFSAGEVA
jgi:hypothetical protein